MALAKLQSVELRSEWPNEARDFTSWLSQEENLQALGSEIGNLDLELVKQEHEVGPYSADIVCRDIPTDSYVLIENQLEKTDHKHLGQIVTYAAGLGAKTVVWIARNFTDEHRAAIDWLNEATGKDYNFFAIEIVLWRIDDSAPAPYFKIVCSPNDWTRGLAESVKGNGDLTDTQECYLRFWSGFKDFLKQKSGAPLRARSARARHYLNFSIGRSGFWLSGLSIATREEIGVELIIDGSSSIEAKDAFQALLSKKDKIEAQLGFEMVWSETTPEVKRSKLGVYKSDEDIENEKNWPAQYEWLSDTLEKVHAVFRPLIMEL